MDLKNYIREVKDFPKVWIWFKDISTLIANPEAFSYAVEKLWENLNEANKILALDARGFLFWWALAYKYNIPLIMARKPGKLPWNVISISYDLEYSKNELELQKDALNENDKVFIIDDLLATGWTIDASIKLVEQLNAKVSSLNFVIELDFLNAREKLNWYKINSLIKY